MYNILFYGRNIKDYKKVVVNIKIAYVHQNAVIFSGSIRKNLMWGKKNASDEEMLNTMNELKDVILSETTSAIEKNDAYNALQALSNSKSECEKIKKVITEKFKYDNFVKINEDTISITIAAKEHNKEIANKIIREVQNMYDKQKYITVKFE